MSSGDWPEVSVAATPDTVEALEGWLFAAGAVSVTYHDRLDQPILEPEPGEMRLWDDIRLVGLFAQAQNPEELTITLHVAASECGMPVPQYALNNLEDTVWERTWMRDFKPMQFGPNLWVCPSYCAPPDANAINILLDPGLAFGTGTHETTAQCLLWLGANTDQQHQPLAGQVVIDYGCGSGLLAIAAAKLGAAEVYAVDIDEQALTATRQNALANGVGQQIKVGRPESLQIEAVDLVLANILFEPLLTLSERFSQLVKPSGSLVMAGMLEEQVKPLCLSYTNKFEFQPPSAQNGWALLSATRRTN